MLAPGASRWRPPWYCRRLAVALALVLGSGRAAVLPARRSTRARRRARRQAAVARWLHPAPCVLCRCRLVP